MSVVVQEWCIVDDGWRQPWRLQCSTSMFEKPRNQRQRGLLGWRLGIDEGTEERVSHGWMLSSL